MAFDPIRGVTLVDIGDNHADKRRNTGKKTDQIKDINDNRHVALTAGDSIGRGRRSLWYHYLQSCIFEPV